MENHKEPETQQPQYLITLADFTNPTVLSLLKTHLAFCQNPTTSPLESIKYVLDIPSLQHPSITLWTIWSPSPSSPTPNPPLFPSTPTPDQAPSEGHLLGCAALKTMTPTSGELKSMHIVPSARGTSCAHSLMTFLLDRAKERGWEKMYLETGTGEAFAPARKFYRRYGFEECGVYGEYEVQSSSCYMAREI